MEKKDKIRLLTFLMIGCLLFFGIQKILAPKWHFKAENFGEGDTDKYGEFYDVPRNSLDYLALGSSQSFYHINPDLIYAESGYTGYDLGGSNQGLLLSYYWLNEAMKYQHPKWVFLTTGSLSYEVTYTNEEQNIGSPYGQVLNMRLSLNKIRLCRACANQYRSFWEYMVPMLVFHDRWNSLTQIDFTSTQEYFMNGGYITFAKQNYTSIENKNSKVVSEYDIQGTCAEKNNKPVTNDNIAVLDDILSLSRKNDAELILLDIVGSYKDEEVTEQVRLYGERNNVEVINISKENLPLDWLSETPDSGHHLNYWGNCKVSDYLSDYLKAKSIASVGKSEKSIQKWTSDLDGFQSLEEGNLITGKDQALTYLNGLANEKKHLTIFCAACDEVSLGADEELEELMKALGFTEDFQNHIQESFIGVVSHGNCLFEKWEAAPMELKDRMVLGGNERVIDIQSAGFVYGCKASIKVNDREFAGGSRGLNFVVLDETGKVISSVVIDTHETEWGYSEKKGVEQNWQRYDAQIVSDGIYTIRPLGYDKYAVEVAGGTDAESENIHIWERTGDKPQQFYIQYAGNGLYYLQAMCSGKYLTVYQYGDTPGTDVVQETYTGLANQKWFIRKRAGNSYEVISLYNHLALDVADGISAAGVNIQLYSKNDTDGQKFVLDDIHDGSV